MIEQLRRFLSSPVGKVCGAVVTLGLIYLAYSSVKGFFRGDTPESALYPTFIDADNGKPFQHELKVGESTPVVSPFSGKNTGYRAEPCFWTKDGKAKTEPTWVLLNSYVNKPEPTFCPDCGRLVTLRNLGADQGTPVPPTREEWFARHQQQN